MARNGDAAEHESSVADSGQGGVERVTANLVPRAARALRRAAELTGDSKTDTINRALQVYEMLEEIMEAGGSVYLRPTPDAEPERLRLF